MAQAGCLQMTEAQQKLKALTGLAVGDCIEVFWKIEHDEENGPGQITEEEKWWAAHIEPESPPSSDCKDGEVQWSLRYTAYGGFEEDVVQVTFLSKHELRDDTAGEEPEMFMWRVAGDDWVGEDDEAEGMDVFQGNREFTSTELADVLGGQIREATGAVSEEEAMNQIASNIDPSRLRQGAAGYREFMEKFKAHIEGVAAQQGLKDGEGLLVTPEIVAEFTRSLKH